MALYTSPGMPSPEPAPEMMTQPAPAPGGGMTSPGFPSPTPTTPPGTGGLDPLPNPSGPYRPIPTRGNPGAPGMGAGRFKPKPLPGGFQRRGPSAQEQKAQLMSSWLTAQKGAGRPSPVRLGSTNIRENPFIKTMGAQSARPKLGRGFAGGRRFQRGLGNAYGHFMKSGAMQKPPAMMPSPDFRQRMGQMVRNGDFARPAVEPQPGGDIRSRMMARRAAFMRRRGGR